jgi:hypothetical protein
MTPINKFPHAKPTKAELGMSNTKLAGYINGVADNLNNCMYKRDIRKKDAH